MKYLSEYRVSEYIEKYINKIKQIARRNWNIMEVCGGQTHAIFRFGIDRLLTENISLLHGPGCPVCVTATDLIDKAITLSQRSNVIFCTFGDMMRVPGSQSALNQAKSAGADIRIVYSPLDAIDIAKKNPDREVVFFSIGFETTAPLIASAILYAHKRDLKNFYILNGLVRIPPAIELLLKNPDSKIDALLAPGHVCTVSGCGEYELISKKYDVPIVITGFEPLDLTQGIYMAVEQLERGEIGTLNQYSRAVSREGNVNARGIINKVFDISDRRWRGLGIIRDSGYVLKKAYKKYDAEVRYDISPMISSDESECIVSDILQGFAKPNQCRQFDKNCTPEHPLGPMMVSAEGVCAAYYKHWDKYVAG
jgi:hydrogenase expression/formation protein HypD